MEALKMKGDDLFPTVILDPENNCYEISGKSVPEDPEEYYDKVLNWLETNLTNTDVNISFVFNLDYFNIASSKRILFLLYKLNEMHINGTNIMVKWYYREEDDDMYEVGQDYAFMVKVPFEFIAYKEKQKSAAMA